MRVEVFKFQQGTHLAVKGESKSIKDKQKYVEKNRQNVG